MTERDPLDHLAEAAESPLNPSTEFADQLLLDLLDRVEPPMSGNKNLTLLELTERDTPMGNNMKWLLSAAAAILLIIGALFVVNRGDGSSVVTEEPANTTTSEVSDEDEQSIDEPTASTTSPSTTVAVSAGESELLAIGDQFLDAFYSGDSTALTEMSAEGAPLSSVLYVQAFAAAANTTVVDRSCEVTGEFGVRCTARADDDIFRALGDQSWSWPRASATVARRSIPQRVSPANLAIRSGEEKRRCVKCPWARRWPGQTRQLA